MASLEIIITPAFDPAKLITEDAEDIDNKN